MLDSATQSEEIDGVIKGLNQVKAIQVFSMKRALKWTWIGLAAFVALQMYFVQEMLAALVLFTIAFAVSAIIVLVLYVVDRAGQWSLGWAGQHSGPAIELVRRGFAMVEDPSKKSFRRPRSESVPKSHWLDPSKETGR
jgi:hypothetical protein